MSATAASVDVREFAARAARLRDANDKFFDEHPVLNELFQWLDRAEETHALNMGNGTGSGLMVHLRDAYCWHTGAPTAEHRATLGKPGSCTNLGQLVDAQITALILGAEVADLHRYTVRLLEFCERMQWLPIASQVPLWHKSLTTYTFVDMLVYDVANRCLVLIELKTGYDHGYDVPLAGAAFEGDLFVDSHRTRHQQQLCWMLTVLRAELPNDVPLLGCVVRVSDEVGVREPDWSEPALADYFERVYIRDDPAYRDRAHQPAQTHE